jgi:hypothetical protein
MTPNEIKAQEIGGRALVRFFDDILTEQRKRWNAPDWRLTPIIDADLINWRDISQALAKQMLPRDYK